MMRVFALWVSLGAAVSLVQETTADQSTLSEPSTSEITFDDLKFEIAKGAKFERKLLSQKIESLNGKTVRLNGQILPASVYQRDGIKKFVFVYSEWRHCVSPLPSLVDSVRVEMADDKSISFSTKPITIEGKFEIREWAIIDGRPRVVYHISATSVK